MSQRELAEVAGVSHVAINDIVNGKTMHPRKRVLEGIARGLHVRSDDLIELARMNVDRTKPIYQPPLIETEVRPLPGAMTIGPIIRLPLYGSIRAGVPCIVEETPDDYMSVDADWIPGDPREYFWLKIDGDSMVDAGFMPGGFALVHLQNTIEDGEIAVVQINGEEATIKQVRLMDGYVMLVPRNARFQPVGYRSAEVRIIGKVKAGLNTV